MKLSLPLVRPKQSEEKPRGPFATVTVCGRSQAKRQVTVPRGGRDLRRREEVVADLERAAVERPEGAAGLGKLRDDEVLVRGAVEAPRPVELDDFVGQPPAALDGVVADEVPTQKPIAATCSLWLSCTATRRSTSPFTIGIPSALA